MIEALPHNLLREYLGAIVIVLPDLEDPVPKEDALTSDADVRYMGILADADAQVIKICPYFLIPRQTDPDREREIAMILAPEQVPEQTGLRARITRGGAAQTGARSRAGALDRRPKLVPISQCDSIQVYREEDPTEELERLLSEMPKEQPFTEARNGQVPLPVALVRVNEASFHEVARQVGSHPDLATLYVPIAGGGGASEAAQALLCTLGHLAATMTEDPQAAKAVSRAADSLATACQELIQATDATARFTASMRLLEGFPTVLQDFLDLAEVQAVVACVSGMRPDQRAFLSRFGCSHPRLIYLAG